jgi:hypothetical protein
MLIEFYLSKGGINRFYKPNDIDALPRRFG